MTINTKTIQIITQIASEIVQEQTATCPHIRHCNGVEAGAKDFFIFLWIFPCTLTKMILCTYS